jgi:hypothetical protein
MADPATWKRRIASWRASGETAEAYATRHGFSASTLKWWAWKLGRETKPVVRVAQLVRVPSSEPAARRGSILIELLDARARIAVDGDADRELFGDVVDILLSRSAR